MRPPARVGLFGLRLLAHALPRIELLVRQLVERRLVGFLVDLARLGLLFKEMGLVATLAAPYAREPVVQNLIASPRLDATHWRSISWRDSNAGYANGRFEMDINAIWVPRALQSIGEILSAAIGAVILLVIIGLFRR